MDLIINLIIAVVVLGMLAVGGLFAWRMVQGNNSSAGLFGNKPDRRLGVVETTTLDQRRKLVLIRRDNVEHLVITGGPIDVVVETEIERPAYAAPRAPSLEPNDPDRVVFGRPSTAQAGE